MMWCGVVWWRQQRGTNDVKNSGKAPPTSLLVCPFFGGRRSGRTEEAAHTTLQCIPLRFPSAQVLPSQHRKPSLLDAPHLRLSPPVFLCLCSSGFPCLAAWGSRCPTTTRSPKSLTLTLDLPVLDLPVVDWRFII